MRTTSVRLRIGALLALIVVVAACATPGVPSPTPSVEGSAMPTPPTAASTPPTTPTVDAPGQPTASPYGLGRFPELPASLAPGPAAAGLQRVIDAAVQDGTFAGITAAVIVAEEWSWSAASGSSLGEALTPDTRRPTHSSAKTIVAAQVLRLVEQGQLGLDDPAADYLPPNLAFVDTNGATVRQVLGMRSGIPDLNEEAGYYPAEQAPTIEAVFRMLPQPSVAPGTELHYASTNYVLLGAIVEHLMGQSLAEALRAGVLNHPGLDGIDFTVGDALAGDGWGVETTPSSWARWGYDLYGGAVISEDSLREMADFRGGWYGLGTFDFSGSFGVPALGHYGESSVTTCCSVIKLAALPEEGVVISVQADTGSSISDRDYFQALDSLTKALRDAART